MEKHLLSVEHEADRQKECETKFASSDSQEGFDSNEELLAATPGPIFRLLARLNENKRLSEVSKQKLKTCLHEIDQEHKIREIHQRYHERVLSELKKAHESEIFLLKQEYFDKKFVRASDLVGTPQPIVTNKMEKNEGTVSVTARIPTGVEEWADFNQQQRSFGEERQKSQYFENLGFIPRVNLPPSIMVGDDCVLHSKRSLQSLTDEWLFIVENHLTRAPESEFFLVSSSKERCGINFPSSPDGVTVLWQRGTASEKAKPVRVTNCWQNTPEWIFDKGSNIPLRYKQEMDAGQTGPIFHLVTQVVGNMLAMGAKTACINTGVHMVGMKLMEDGVVMITPAVSGDATGLDSTWHFIDFILHSPEAWKGFTKIPNLPIPSTEIKARPDIKSAGSSKGSAGASKGQGAAKEKGNQPTQARNDGPGGKGASLSRGLFERPSALNAIDSLRTKPPPKKIAGTASSEASDNGAEIQYLHKLQESEDRVVWRARRQDAAAGTWADVVIKWYRTESEGIPRYDNEVACYRQATSMQARSSFL
jgi:hypothetical protein